MSKTITVEIALPDWVKWVATDEDGRMYAHSARPAKAVGHWMPTGGRYKHIANSADACPNWRETLRKV